MERVRDFCIDFNKSVLYKVCFAVFAAGCISAKVVTVLLASNVPVACIVASVLLVIAVLSYVPTAIGFLGSVMNFNDGVNPIVAHTFTIITSILAAAGMIIFTSYVVRMIFICATQGIYAAAF